jgi:tRNA-modifying protein YgfZ
MSSTSDTPAHALTSRSPASLSHLGILRFAGPDALSFLQGQISNDTRGLAEGSAILAAYSNAQGRVVAILRLLPHSSGILAILPRALVVPVLERLRKFVLRAKVKIEDVSNEFEILGAHDASTVDALSGGQSPAPDRSFVEHAGIAVARVASSSLSSSGRFWVIRPAGERGADQAQEVTASLEGVKHFANAWRLADIRDGLPQVYAETSEAFVAQMLNLDLLDAISFTKGCYTGQEIIARTQHLGRIKRRMFRLQLPAGSWAIGQALHLADGRTGKLVEVASDGERVEALAVLTLEPGTADSASDAGNAAHEGNPARSSDLAEATELPLPYSMARV